MDKNEETGLTYSLFKIFVNSFLVTEFRLTTKIYLHIRYLFCNSDAEIFYLKYFLMNYSFHRKVYALRKLNN